MTVFMQSPNNCELTHNWHVKQVCVYKILHKAMFADMGHMLAGTLAYITHVYSIFAHVSILTF